MSMNASRKITAETTDRGPEAVDERSIARMNFRTKPHIKQAIQRAAAWSGIDDSAFVINAAYKAALETIESHERMVVSQRDFNRILDAIENPAPPSEKLRNAFARHRETVESK